LASLTGVVLLTDERRRRDYQNVHRSRALNHDNGDRSARDDREDPDGGDRRNRTEEIGDDSGGERPVHGATGNVAVKISCRAAAALRPAGTGFHMGELEGDKLAAVR
jgi:hypothetical protein